MANHYERLSEDDKLIVEIRVRQLLGVPSKVEEYDPVEAKARMQRVIAKWEEIASDSVALDAARRDPEVRQKLQIEKQAMIGTGEGRKVF